MTAKLVSDSESRFGLGGQCSSILVYFIVEQFEFDFGDDAKLVSDSEVFCRCLVLL